MKNHLMIIFLSLSAIFVVAHYFAVKMSLYWWHWWFDVVMHFSGGILIALAIFTLAGFSQFNFKPNLKLMLLTLFIMTVTWEIFEFFADLWQPETYIIDTIQDIALGFAGGLLTYRVLKTDTIEG